MSYQPLTPHIMLPSLESLTLDELHALNMRLINELAQVGAAIQEKCRQIQITENDLTFEPDGRSIRWNQGLAKLGRKSCRFVRVLWESKKKHRASVLALEKKIWNDQFVNPHTFEMFVLRLNKALKDVNFPFQIIKLKNISTNEIKGYQLKKIRPTK